MDKNIKLPLLITVSIGVLFIGILLGTFIGRNSNPDANALQFISQHAETNPEYTLPFLTNETGKINVNTATAEELTMLPGIGKETAERIIEYRTKYGVFFSLDELSNVKGIGENTVIKLKPYATVGG